MNFMENLRFTIHKKRRKRERFYAILITVIGIVMAYISSESGISIPFILSIVTILLGVRLLVKSFKKVETVLVNENGIKTRICGLGFIEWEHIEDFEVSKGLKGMDFLAIKLRNEEDFLSSKSKVMQKIMKSNNKKIGSPASIPQSELNEPVEVALEKIQAYRNQLS